MTEARRWRILGLLTLCAAMSARAESPASEACPAPLFVEEKLEYWQQRLQLSEWNISLVMTRRSDLKAKTLGGIRWDKGKKTAAIAVMDPSDYRMPCAEMLEDLEFTIVHELVHLELASLPRSEASRSTEEHAVNRIAEALVKLQRHE